MPTRDYQGFSIASGSRGTAPVAGAPLNVTRPVPEQGTTVAGQVLQGLLKVGGAIADRNLENEIDAAYIEGQRQRSLGTAVEDIQGDAVMAPFLRGGYATQDYRMAQAKFAQDTQNFIDAEGRAIAPEEFAKSITESSSAITKDISAKLPRAERANALASQAQTEQALITYQANEHAKYSMEQVATRYTTQGNQLNSELTKARAANDPDAYTQSAARVSLFLQDVLTGTGLPPQIRTQVAADYTLSLLATDHADLVERAIGEGALDALPPKERYKISNALRESRNRTRDRESLGVLESNGKFYADLAEGRATIDQVRAFVQTEVQAQRMTADEAETVYKTFYKSPSDTEHTSAVLGPLARYDVAGIAAAGSTTPKAIMIRDRQALKAGGNFTTVTLAGIQDGIVMGGVPPELGRRMGEAQLAVAANPDGVNKDQAELLDKGLTLINSLKAKNPAAAERFLAAVPEEGRAVMAFALDAHEQGVDKLSAMRMATAKTDEFNNMQEAGKIRVTSDFQKKSLDQLDSTFGNNMWGQVKEVVGFIPGAGDAPNVRSQMYYALVDEVKRLSKNPANIALFAPGTDPEKANTALLKVASANLSKRVIKIAPGLDSNTAGGTLLLIPRDTSAEAIFGDADPRVVGMELAKRYPAVSGDVTSEFQLVRGPDNRYQLQNLQVGEDGVAVSRTVVDTAGLLKVVNDRTVQMETDKRHADFGGGGATVVGTDGKKFVLSTDGRNELGLRTSAVYDWRKRLLTELPPMLDSKADATTRAVVEETFARSTNDALRATLSDVLEAKMGAGSPLHLSVARASLLAGPDEFKGYTEVRAAIRNRDNDALNAAVIKTPWYKRDPEAAKSFLRQARPELLNYWSE